MKPTPAIAGLFLLALLAAAAGTIFAIQARSAPDDDSRELVATLTPELPTHERFTQLLQGAVHMPRVDYGYVQENRQELDGYIAELARTAPSALRDAPRADALAFWINAYNACMLKIVVDHYPIEAGGTGLFGAIRNRVAGYPDNSVWQIRDVFTRAHCPVAGENRSQDEIEHEIIRPEFQEPRIHFAVNCAAVSCPVLQPEAYRGSDLEAQLERAVAYLMEDRRHFRLEPGPPPTLTLNRVLDWYSEDFGGIEGLKRFFEPYVDPSEADLLRRSDIRVEFFEYDWTLNDVPR